MVECVCVYVVGLVVELRAVCSRVERDIRVQFTSIIADGVS
jgi:hypothetical protein